jgi:hypothetical protein
MVSLLSNTQMQLVKTYIYKNARLLERQLFAYFFGTGTKQACVKALAAYQNADGGFGNGLEPDLLCPDSSAIGAETALFVMDLLDDKTSQVLDPLLQWITANQDEIGTIPHPPKGLDDYPHQPWWKNSDAERVLALAGYLRKFGVKHSTFFNKVRAYFHSLEIPSPENYYSYPYFIYLKYCRESVEDQQKLASMIAQLPLLLDKHADHFSLFSRAWYHAASFLDRNIVVEEAQKCADAFCEDGSLAAPYPELPWWRPIWTMDGLILLKRFGFMQ